MLTKMLVMTAMTTEMVRRSGSEGNEAPTTIRERECHFEIETSRRRWRRQRNNEAPQHPKGERESVVLSEGNFGITY